MVVIKNISIDVLSRLTFTFFLLYNLACCPTAYGQENHPDTLNKKRLSKVVIGSAVAYSATMIGLNQVWYSDFDKQPFSFFDDSKEWLQVDKAGHFYGAFQLSNLGATALKWTGLNKKRSDRIGSLASFLMISSIEIFDGYSTGYGASATDLLANATGVSFFLGQQMLWEEIRIQPKFSFHTTYLANQRPDVLGSNFHEKLIKDYNGQTYWLSFDMDKFTKFPKWINIAVGYGAHNQIFANKGANVANNYDPYRQYYLSIDFDTTAIKTNSKLIKSVLYFVNMVKLPSPTLEFSNGQLKTHAFYF